MSFKEKYIKKPHPFVLVGILVISSLFIYSSADFYQDTEEHTDEAFSTEEIPAVVVEILSEEEVPMGFGGEDTSTRQLLLVSAEIDDEEKQVEAQNDITPLSEGDRVFIMRSFFDAGLEENFEEQSIDELEQEPEYYVTQINRTGGLFLLLFLFVAIVIMVSGLKGIRALIGVFVSLAVIFAFMIPYILEGFDPVMVGLFGSFVILIFTIYTAYGFNRKSLAAFLGISLTLIFVAGLAHISVYGMNFTGFSSEASMYLSLSSDIPIDLTGLIIAGIIIAGIGVLDDVAISQSSTVFALHFSNKKMGRTELFKRAMKVGRDHIFAVINTLVLAYTGAALPLILLMTLSTPDASTLFNNEMIAEEVVRTIISSSGLILAVPLTTLIAAWLVCMYGKGDEECDREEENEHH